MKARCVSNMIQVIALVMTMALVVFILRRAFALPLPPVPQRVGRRKGRPCDVCNNIGNDLDHNPGYCEMCRARYYCSARCQYYDYHHLGHKKACERYLKQYWFING